MPDSSARDQAMATSAARPKILPRPSATARCEAVLNTFSKTRGTARMNVGWNSARSSSRFLMSAEWPIRTRALTQPTWMIRANTWASGRNSSVDGCTSAVSDGGSNSSSSSSTATVSSNMKLPWVSMQPLGRPVVPEV